MKSTAPLFAAALALALSGAGCFSPAPSAPSTESPTSTQAVSPAVAPSQAHLTGQLGDATIDMRLVTLFGQVRGSFTYVENGQTTFGLAYGSATSPGLVFGLYSGRLDDFAQATGTWQNQNLNLEFTRGSSTLQAVLMPVTDNGATYRIDQVSRKDTRDDGSDRCTFNFAMPVLTGGSDTETLSVANDALRKSFGLTPTSTVQTLADEFIGTCKSDIADLESDSTTAEFAKDTSYDSETFFTVERNRDGVASFLIDSYDYEGGAHGMNGIYGVNLNLSNGAALQLGDLVKRDQLKPLVQLVEGKILKEYSDALFDEALAGFKKLVADKKPASEEELVNYAGLDNFYLTDTGFVFYWNEYEIAPYAAGQLTVDVPFSEIKDMLRSDAPGSSLN